MAGQKVILDTCIVIELQRGNKDIINRVSELEQHNIFVTPIVIAEFYRGARNKAELAKCRKLIGKFTVLSLNEPVTEVFNKIFDKFSISHRPSVPDMLIASAAIHYDISLYTDNKADFNFIPGLQLFK